MDEAMYYSISGRENGIRVESRILEERIQEAVSQGRRHLQIKAYGQHGIGGRLWRTGGEKVHLRISGPVGQRLGSMGSEHTLIEVLGPVSDDVGWLNAGATIVVHGNAGNGAGNAMAQGKIYIGGNIGARGMTMTKHNPRFDPPELWVLGSVGDYFGEFMAGGLAVICGHEAQNPKNVLGYRPLVGMVGGKVFFRGPHEGYSASDAKAVPISDVDWQWLSENLRIFLQHLGKVELLYPVLSKREEWQCLAARSPQERLTRPRRGMKTFRIEVWEKTLGQGGLVGDLIRVDREPLPLITRGEWRRFVPVWENGRHLAPCQGACPTGIPVQERWRLVREGRTDEAVDLALAYTPFPATVCGYLCPHLCMQNCTRQSAFMTPVDIGRLGRASLEARLPELPSLSGNRIAVIGAGPAGLSVAWQLRLQGHEAVVYDTAEEAGGKIEAVIPGHRLPEEVFKEERQRIREVIPHIHLRQRLGKEEFERLLADFDFLVVAVGAQRPRVLKIPGGERLIPALDFLARTKKGKVQVGRKVVIIGAGNVGCDVAVEAARMGAEDILLLDVQQPASFGKERQEAERVGARFRWPVQVREVTEQGVILEGGELLPADTVFVAVGDVPETGFLPDDIALENGFIRVDEYYRTSNPQVFAVGDVVKPGLITDAIGAGRKAAQAISDLLAGRKPATDPRRMIPKERIRLEYYDPRIVHYEDLDQCGAQCASCGQCRDCGICAALCPEAAISKVEKDNGGYEYVVDGERCIGCGFCAGACPCGIWTMVENPPPEV
jgi:NADPH-dependent glutamate synthase beta subunit-like oxidoreductase/glutamate synthase domain-containing protein 3/Pyruvate/2-oxoacid:ferredoxin oxidoreductase delta subunit